jgi:predicted TIM-barrel fold metal-dependent hydrolase
MRNGYRVIDADTHVNPSLDTLLRYADKALLSKMDRLEPNIRRTQPTAGRGDSEGNATVANLVIAPLRYGRVAGQKPTPPEDAAAVGHNLAGRTRMVTREPIAVGVAEDNAIGRLGDMDREGRDIDFIIPGPWAYGVASLDKDLTAGLLAAYHRYIADYCSADLRRLKSMVIVSGLDPEASALAIREHAAQDWAAAVWPVLPEGLPIDDPDLEPIWQAANEFGLPIMYHGFHVEPPYFPGYRDVWDNPAVGRAAGQTWGGQRFLSFMLISGILDRNPNLKIGMIECGHGWLPHWVLRLTRQVDYVRGATPADLKYTPAEYVAAGRVFCGIDFSEGVAMTKAVIDLLGDGVLLYQSDYPHPETVFPDHVDTVVAWEDTLGESSQRKLMWENATNFFRLQSTPWD